MDRLTDVDRRGMVVPETPVPEIVIRGTVRYLALFTLLRGAEAAARRRGVHRLLVIVLIADTAHNAMAGNDTSMPDRLLLLIGVIVGWAYSLDWLGYRVPLVRRFVHASSVRLVSDGRLLRQNLRRENITDDELWSQLRTQGVEDLDEVDEVLLEGDGQLSVVRTDRERPQRPRRRQL